MRRAIAAGRGRGIRTVAPRRRLFRVWAAMLSALLGVTFTGTTALTVALWIAGENDATNPVMDIGFFALGAIVTAGVAVQLRDPARQVGGMQQAVAGVVALGVAGIAGQRIEPALGAAIALALLAPLVALHPARESLLRPGKGRHVPQLALALAGLVPASARAVALIADARRAGPSCFLGRCAEGDRPAELAALALTVVACVALAAAKPAGWRVTAWSAGLAAMLVGALSVALPAEAGSLGVAGGALAVGWGAAVIAVAERGRQRIGGPS